MRKTVKINGYDFDALIDTGSTITLIRKTEKLLFVNTLTESNDHPKASMSTKEREIKPSKCKTKKLKSSGRNANKTSDSEENQALAKEKNDLLRQIDFLNSITFGYEVERAVH
ncbi:hypothetical protein TNCV_2538531 [Trichonephila clavipes]|nr:hypothetical protein TNCV_2538531 [Trichonephila clavipes]